MTKSIHGGDGLMLNTLYWDRQRHLGRTLSTRRVIHCPQCGVWGVINQVGESCHKCGAVVKIKLPKKEIPDV